MKKIKAKADFGFVGCERNIELEFDDDATDEEISDEVYRWACEYIHIGWEEVE